MNSRSTISAIGRACVQRSSIIPPAVCERHETEVEIMKRLGLVYENNAQCMALSSLATVSMTRLAKPCPAKQDPPTTYEARSKLTAEGWEPVMAAYKCSVSDKRMMKHQCSSYYRLLIQNRDEILQMTEENFFSHAQKSGYYDVVAFACSVKPFDLWLVFIGMANFVFLFPRVEKRCI